MTLTSTPSRLHAIKPALNSLLRQSQAPDAVVLCLPRLCHRGGAYRIPSFLQRCGAVTVLRCEHDWGPASKLIPSLLEFGDRPTRFLVVDDDNVYPANFVETFLRWSEVLPDCALGYRAHVFREPVTWSALGAIYGSNLVHPYQVDLVTGTWGFLVRESFFDEAVTDYGPYPEGAFYVDDIWFNGHMARRGVPRVVIPANSPPLPTVSAYRHALGVEHNADGRYNEETIRAFSGAWRSE